MNFYTLEMNEAEKVFVVHAIKDMADYLIDQIEDSVCAEEDDEPMSMDESAKTLVDNVIANATREIEVLKEQIAERDKEIAILREEMTIPVKKEIATLREKLATPVAVHHTVKEKGLNPAPYGLKKDGTPAKKRGRKSTKGN